MKNNLYYPFVSLSDEDIFTEIKREREDIGYYSLPYADLSNMKSRLDNLDFKQKNIAIIGMERADAFAIYDITNPTTPVFIKMYKTGDAPEGIIFIPASKSPINQSLIVTSNENDGTIKIYKTTKL